MVAHMVEDTWNARDYPALEAIVELGDGSERQVASSVRSAETCSSR
jgi:hypothetical protein